MDVLNLILGLIGLLVGAEMAVSGSLALAHRWGWPSWVTGVILLALGTSLPEFFVAVASAPAHPGLALGTVLGSNAINVGGVLGIVLLLQTQRGIPLRDANVETLVALIGGSLLAFWAFGSEEIPLAAALALLGLFLFVLAVSLRSGGGGVDTGDYVVGEGTPEHPTPRWKASALAVGGFVLLAFASDLFLNGALGIAATLGWKEGFVGFLIAAGGTSAPEFFTSVKSIRKGHAGAVFGNVLGSNAFNLLMVGGFIGVIADAPINPQALRPQLWANLAFCVALALPMIFRRDRPGRTKAGVVGGGVLLAGWVLSAWWIGFADAGV